MKVFPVLFLLCCLQDTMAQSARENIYSSFVLYEHRSRLDNELRQHIIANTFSEPWSPDNEDKYESACLAISQFQFTSELIREGLQNLLMQYDSLQYDTRRAVLEAVYGVYPTQFREAIHHIIEKETHPKLFSMCAAYLFRPDPSIENSNTIKIRMVEQFPEYDSVGILSALNHYLNDLPNNKRRPTPTLTELFSYNRTAGRKVIYSFQRWNRDYPGLAIVQYADGRFARHPDGRLMVFEQLARSASDLPYFITNGSTPQGVYSIRGIGVSNNNFIGPTPNLQLTMPYEGKWENYFQLPINAAWDSTQDVWAAYQQLWPASWRNYPPVAEAFRAGKIGRTEIIAHGTTIDPLYFKDKPYYPLTPTMGCLCTKELWNVTNGRLLVSEQFNLISVFTATPGSKGYLYVINLDDQQQAVSRAEIEKLLNHDLGGF